MRHVKCCAHQPSFLGGYTQRELNKRIRIDPSAEDGDTVLTELGESNP
jgi:hypothetical protein